MGAIEELVAFVNSEWRGGDHKRRADVLVAAVNAELAARGEERVVEAIDDKDGWVRLFDDSGRDPLATMDNEQAAALRFEAGKRYAIRRLPDPPKPAAIRPWLIRPNAAQPYLVCGYCQWRAEVGAVACGECGKRFLEPEELPESAAGEGAK